jgi:hypothetical protein
MQPSCDGLFFTVYNITRHNRVIAVVRHRTPHPLLVRCRSTQVRDFLSVTAVILMVLGTIWFFQGINFLPGSFMTGQPKWAAYGATAFVLGVGVMFFVRRKQ